MHMHARDWFFLASGFVLGGALPPAAKFAFEHVKAGAIALWHKVVH